MASVSRDDFKENPDDTFNNLIQQFIEYYDFLYRDYVENVNQENLSKGARNLVKIIESDIDNVSIES